MSFKDYFSKAQEVQSITNKSAAQIADEVESVGYHTQDIIKEERFIPQVDYRFPENFAKYGSAEEYYDQALKRIYEDYPYDGSLKEKLEWENDATYLDLHLFKDAYPRTNGYAIFSAEGGETTGGISADGYGTPTTNEYIYFKGGPHPNPGGMTPIGVQFTGSNYYETALNRENNLKFDLKNKGVSIEFWLKKSEFIPAETQKEVIFDLWNNVTPQTKPDYGRLQLVLTSAAASPFRLTVLSGTTGVLYSSIASSAITTASVADGNWHHYAVTLASASSGIASNFYIDGTLNNTAILGAAINEVTGALQAQIGALITQPQPGSPAVRGSGKLSGSLDELRYWKTERTGKDIGRYWFTQVGGGTNTDPTPYVQTPEKVNTNLGVYYKFNEGITGNSAIDSVVLDYSGRITNGAWTGYSSASRNTGSAIVISKAAIREFKDPIIHSSHPKVRSLAARLKLSGSNYDVNNNASIYNSIPAWIMEEDLEGQKQLKYLTQILASYFDTLQLQIGSLSKLQTVTYPSSSHKPLPFAEHLLQSAGFVAPELFIDADVLEKLADRSEDRLYEKSLQDIKNTIYHNIYNNLVYIYKSKGTEKSFRNLMRCFGIDDELVKLNVYAGGVEYEVRNNRRNVSVAEKFIDFNTADNKNASVFQFQDPLDTTNTTGIVFGSTHLTGGYATTLEADILFPKKPDQNATFYFDTNVISSSLFGVHQPINSETITTWHSLDDTNFQVYAVRDEITSPNVRFVLTGTVGGHVPKLTSPLYQNTYDNTSWNLAVRIKPENYPLAGLAAHAAGPKYTVELHGVQIDAGVLLNEFTVSETITPPVGFITGSKRVYIGSHRTNFSGALLQSTDVKVNACRYWMDYLEDRALRGHAYDTRNYGALKPHVYAYPFQASASYGGEILQVDTLAFNWEFSQVTGSNTSGQFTVSDEFSGSAITAATRFDWLGNILGKQHPALGTGFPASSIKVTDKDFVIASKLQLPENIQSSDAVTVLNLMEQKVFTRESRPVDFFYAFEKSMAQSLSVEMINYFATLKDIHNIIGEPVNRYRPEYKGLKVLRQRFFSRVSNSEIDFEKFYEFYKWFDSSLTMMLQQLIPASADFAENVRTVIESHMLERSKYQHKFQNVKQQLSAIEGVAVGSEAQAEMSTSPEDDPQGTGFYSANAYTKRAIGSSQPIDFKRWDLQHAPPPTTPGGVPPQNQKSIWWRARAERNISTIRSSDSRVNKNKQTILTSIKVTNKRATQAPYRFGGSGNYTLGGVGFNQNKRVNFVYRATTPFGSTRNSAPTDVIVGYGSEVEKLITTTDAYHPAYKQRLGFEMDPDINQEISGRRKADGNLILPFSLYSASVTTGADAEVGTSYATGTIITNLHHDLVYNSDIPMQTPFTEKFVGGRQYRHAELNPGSDDYESRGEGWKIKFANVADAEGGNFATPMLGVVPPNYDAGTTKASIPTAQRLRNVGTKRPVNIQNIKMVTSSLGTRLSGVLAQGSIGNYQKNYQIVQSNAREKNDPFFNDQSFDFALYPETLATRGRFPLTPEDFLNPGKSVEFDGSNEYLAIYGSVGDWDGRIGGSAPNALPFSVSMWIKPTSLTPSDKLWEVGDPGSDNGRWMEISVGPAIVFYSSRKDKAITSTLSTGAWIHVVATFEGLTGNAPKIYIDGVLDVDSSTGGVTDPDDLTTNPMFIAGNGANGFDGYMCDVAVWDTDLDTDDIEEVYNDGTRVDLTTLTPAANLLSWWKLGNHPLDSTTGTLYDGVGPANATPTNMESGDLQEVSPPAEAAVVGAVVFGTANPGGTLNYALPARTGSASNQSIIVNRFAGCGYEVMSRGYMGPAHEELSVYNALPYRNLAVIDYGLSGSASVDPVAARTITVVDQINKNRGLDQRSTLHCGPFGSDAAYGSVPALTYVTTPSYHKTNRNASVKPTQVGGNAIGWPPGADDPGTARLQFGTADEWEARIGKPVAAALPFTISTWINIAELDSSGTFIFEFGNLDIAMFCNSVGAVSFYQDGVPVVSSFATLSENTWYNIVVTYAGGPGGAGNIYINGTIEQTFTDDGAKIVNRPLTLGSFPSNPDNYCLIGQMAQFAVWDTVLGPGDILDLYHGGEPYADIGTNVYRNGYQEPWLAENLIAWYRFDAKYGDSDSIILNQAPSNLGRLNSTNVYSYNLAAPSGSLPFWENLPTYDNHYVQHAIPRSTQQYSWVSASMAQNHRIYGLFAPSAISASSVPGLMSGSQINKAVTFNGMSTVIIDPADYNTRTLGFALGTPTSSYLNPQNPAGIDKDIRHPSALNFLNTVRNGPYGYPTWKQIRTGENHVARLLRHSNMIGALVPPPTVPGANGFVEGLKSNDAVLYEESPLDYGRSRPMIVAFEDNTTDPDEANNVVLKVPFQSKLEYFDHESLNSRLGLQNRYVLAGENAVDAIRDYGLSSSFSAMYRYGQKAYPAIQNAGTSKVRIRENYSILDVWNDVRNLRSIGAYNTVGLFPTGASGNCGGRGGGAKASVWPLDTIENFHLTASVAGLGSGSATAGLLQNTYTHIGAKLGNTPATPWPSASSAAYSITASACYVYPIASLRARYSNTYTEAGYAGLTPLILGYHPWVADSQAGLEPYRPYEIYAKNIQLVGRDMSIVPEFRISEHMEQYDALSMDFLQKLDNIFTLTGSTYPDSSYGEFYKTYTNADFLKFFKVVDEKLEGKANQAGKRLVRHSLDLTCKALLQFLPYKGLYPAERTTEIARLFKQSMGSYSMGENLTQIRPLTTAFDRILIEPLFAPGILFNTIKSGVAVPDFILANTQSFAGAGSLLVKRGESCPMNAPTRYALSASQPSMVSIGSGSCGPRNNAPLLGVHGGAANEPYLLVGNGSASALAMSEGSLNTGGYFMHKLPFEAIRDPEKYLSMTVVPHGRIYDRGIGFHRIEYASQNEGMAANYSYIAYNGGVRSKLYKYAIDNFLCETYNFFQTQPKSFMSNEEDDFLPVEKDKYYGLKVTMHQPLSVDCPATEPAVGAPPWVGGRYSLGAQTSFTMYNNNMGYGPGIGMSQFGGYDDEGDHVTWEHLLPPSYYGSAEVNIILKAPYTGKITLDEIQAHAILEFDKNVRAGLNTTSDAPNSDIVRWSDRGDIWGTGMNEGQFGIINQITASIDVNKKFLVVPPGTTTQKARWLIQPKFECPVMNFFGVSASAGFTRTNGTSAGGSPSKWSNGLHTYNYSQDFNVDVLQKRGNYGLSGSLSTYFVPVRGMWHQYGSIPTGSDGVFLEVGDVTVGGAFYNSSTYGSISVESLAGVVGFDSVQKKIGQLKEAKRIEEAIVCVPFITVGGEKRFFDIEVDSQEYITQLSLLNKYIFPPTFDFLTNESTNPIAFYGFEFFADLDQEDLQRIWQNLPPKLAENSKFQKQTSRIRIRALVERLLGNDQDLQWMVFKVKRKAEKDFNIFMRKNLIEGTPIVQPSLDTPYSYNWPYDYFSLVELVSIDQEAVYTTEDISKTDVLEDPVKPELLEFIPTDEELSFTFPPPPIQLDIAAGVIPAPRVEENK